MKKINIFILLVLCMVTCGCSNDTKEKTVKNNKADSVDTGWIKNVSFQNYNDENSQSNLISGGLVVEKGNMIVFHGYTYNKENGEVGTLCKNPTCNHEPDKTDCVLNKGIYAMQIYKDDILCIVNSATDKIYKYDPQTGELEEKYDVGMPVSNFRMIGEELALVQSDDGFYTVDLQNKKYIQIMKGEFYNTFFTVSDGYMYVSLENLDLHKVNLRGEEDTIIAEKAGRPIICGEKVYYGYWQDEDWNLRSVDINSKDDNLIIEDMVSHTIYKDKIYYSTASYPRKGMMSNIDGSEKKELLQGEVSFSVLPQSEKMLVELSKDTGMEYQLMNLDGSDAKVLVSETGE